MFDSSGRAWALPASNRLIFGGRSPVVGTVRCSPQAPEFGATCAAVCHCFAFARSAVTIRPARRRWFVEDPTVVSFYNAGQEYRRAAVAPDGDRCEWFGVAEPLVREVVRRYDPAAADAPDPFRFGAVRVPGAVYLRQRLLCEALRAQRSPDRLYVEESVVHLLADVVRACYPDSRGIRTAAGGRTRDIAMEAATVLARRSPFNITLDVLARELGVSVFHLCRAFRRTHGATIHQYLVELRVRRALELLDRRGSTLTAVAMDFQFAHHSHFTAAFRKEFGAPPSRVRARLLLLEPDVAAGGAA